ncbi:unnamed protein product [Sphagnum troendelagicum]|uniref:Uncharacterized protein n=1 Tax=Sphagnum troendelagicum TaxID=128251 RepID=A0ABP0ULY2_9BRYO
MPQRRNNANAVSHCTAAPSATTTQALVSHYTAALRCCYSVALHCSAQRRSNASCNAQHRVALQRLASQQRFARLHVAASL